MGEGGLDYTDYYALDPMVEETAKTEAKKEFIVMERTVGVFPVSNRAPPDERGRR